MTACHCPCVTSWTAISKSSLISVFIALLRRRPSPCRTSPSADARTSSGRLWSRSATASAGSQPLRRIVASRPGREPFLVQVGQEDELHLGVGRQASGGRRDRAASGEPPAGLGPGSSATAPCRCTSRIMASGACRGQLGVHGLDGRQQLLAQLRLIRKLLRDALLGFVQDLPGGHGAPLAVGIREFKDAHQEVAGLLRLVGFRLRASLFLRCPRRCPSAVPRRGTSTRRPPRPAPSPAAPPPPAADRRMPPHPLDRTLHAPHRPRPDRLALPGSAAGRRPAPRRWRSAAPAPCCRHFRQIVSRSRGTLRLQLRTAAPARALSTCISVSSAVAALNGGRPVRHSYRIAPRAYTSAAGPTSSRLAAGLLRGHVRWACPSPPRLLRLAAVRRPAAWPGRSR